MANLVVNIKKTDNKVHFEGVSNENPDSKIQFDFAQPLGTGYGFTGLEVLLLSFAGCVSTTLVFLLNRLERHILSYEASVEGIRSTRPLALKDINFHILIESRDIDDLDMETIIKQAEVISPVWQAIKNNVNVKITYELKRIE